MTLPERTLWAAKVIGSGRGMDGRRQVATLDEAILVSSLCTNGRHAPALDCDYRVSLCMDGGAFTLRFDTPFELPSWWSKTMLGWLLARLGIAWNLSVSKSPEEGMVTRVQMQMQVGVEVIPSSSEDRFHVYMHTEMNWEDYERMIQYLSDGGLLNKGFTKHSRDRKMTMLLKPGLRKADLAALGVTLESHSDEKEK